MCCFRDSGAMEEARIFLYERISYQGMESIEISFHSIIYCGVVAEKKLFSLLSVNHTVNIL